MLNVNNMQKIVSCNFNNVESEIQLIKEVASVGFSRQAAEVAVSVERRGYQVNGKCVVIM